MGVPVLVPEGEVVVALAPVVATLVRGGGPGVPTSLVREALVIATIALGLVATAVVVPTTQKRLEPKESDTKPVLPRRLGLPPSPPAAVALATAAAPQQRAQELRVGPVRAAAGAAAEVCLPLPPPTRVVVIAECAANRRGEDGGPDHPQPHTDSGADRVRGRQPGDEESRVRIGVSAGHRAALAVGAARAAEVCLGAAGRDESDDSQCYERHHCAYWLPGSPTAYIITSPAAAQGKPACPGFPCGDGAGKFWAVIENSS